MSLTLTIPTWKQVADVIFLVVAFYSALVAPQYDWIVFGVVYYFGVCVALRSWWRRKTCLCGDTNCNCPCALGIPLACLAWPLAPLLAVTKLLVTVGNSRRGGD